MKYFWINLENSVSRRINLLKEFADNNITEHYRVNAYLSVDDTKSAKESACCRSHLQALTHFLLNTNDEYALICEDDLTFELKKYWKQSVEDVVKNAPSDWGIIQLATIIQNIDGKFSHRELYFKWGDQKSSSCLAWVIHRKCAIKLLNTYISSNNIFAVATPDCWSSGIYQRVDKYTEFTSYTYKYPMFIYPDDNDSQLDNSLDLHKASKRQLLQYLEKNED
jgi:GR25 family glycosyltransferase involved in LPS biosynthesis